MKRFAPAIVGLILVALTALVVVSSKPSASWQLFERQFPDVLNHANYVVLSESTASGDQGPLPWTVRLRRAFVPMSDGNAITSGFPEGARHYVLECNSTGIRVHCLVRCIEGKVVRMVIWYPNGAKPQALRLRDTLHQAFPGEMIDMRESGDV